MSKIFMQKARLILLSFGFLFLAFGTLSQSAPLLWLATFCATAFVMLVLSRPELRPIEEPTEYEADWSTDSYRKLFGDARQKALNTAWNQASREDKAIALRATGCDEEDIDHVIDLCVDHTQD